MKSPILGMLTLVLLAMPGHAQQSRTEIKEIVIGGGAPAAAHEGGTAIREVVVGGKPLAAGGKPSATDAHERCTEVEIGGDKSYGCLNQRLRRKVDQVNPTTVTAPLDAKSQDIKVGVVNMPAVQQQYGRNFGVSVIPYRPPTPTYSSPIGHR